MDQRVKETKENCPFGAYQGERQKVNINKQVFWKEKNQIRKGSTEQLKSGQRAGSDSRGRGDDRCGTLRS